MASIKHDLFARFTFRVDVPPLEARREDIPLLVRHIIRRAARAGDEVAREMLPGGDVAAEPVIKRGLMLELLGLDYPLNVRELEAALWSRLAAPEMWEHRDVDLRRSALRQLSPAVETPDVDADSPGNEGHPLGAARIQACLDEHNGVVELTWRALGFKNRFALLRAIKKHELVIRKRPGQGKLRQPRDS